MAVEIEFEAVVRNLSKITGKVLSNRIILANDADRMDPKFVYSIDGIHSVEIGSNGYVVGVARYLRSKSHDIDPKNEQPHIIDRIIIKPGSAEDSPCARIARKTTTSDESILVFKRDKQNGPSDEQCSISLLDSMDDLGLDSPSGGPNGSDPILLAMFQQMKMINAELELKISKREQPKINGLAGLVDKTAARILSLKII